MEENIEGFKFLSFGCDDGSQRCWGELAEDGYQFRDGVHNVVTRVEMCHETGSVLLNLHRRGNPHLSYSVTELRTKC